ncbi:MAG TPA: fatty acid desaturase [Methylomirabilota bacterium]|nr:fatty acid desaturase [Methylomirabilota bacterium]
MRRSNAFEWQTAILAAGIYGGWLAVTYAYTALPLWVVAPLAAVLITAHSSLQHEIVHGHPSRSRLVNGAIGKIPLSLWLPFARYKQMHLLHHMDDRLTDPLDDPESYYWTDDDWRRIGLVGRLLVVAQTTLAGRVVIGPFWSIGRFLLDEFGRLVAGSAGARRIWAEHLLWCAPVVLWLTAVCGMPLWVYVLAMVMPGTGILLIRSFAEHKAMPDAKERIAIVENARILGPLFLFNNLHALHHERPTIPWYRYPAWYRENRDRLIAENGGLVYDSYLDIARRYLFTPHDAARHPFGRVGADVTVAAERAR